VTETGAETGAVAETETVGQGIGSAPVRTANSQADTVVALNEQPGLVK
jgi:hypothetical protein